MLSNYLNANKLADDMSALSTAQAMIWFAPDGTVLDANENFLKALGYRLDEIVGKHHRIFCEDAIRQSSDYQRFWSDLAAGRFQGGQFRRQSKAGEDVWIEATYNPILDAAGRATKIIKIATDVTAQVQAKQMLEQAVQQAQGVTTAAKLTVKVGDSQTATQLLASAVKDRFGAAVRTVTPREAERG